MIKKIFCTLFYISLSFCIFCDENTLAEQIIYETENENKVGLETELAAETKTELAAETKTEFTTETKTEFAAETKTEFETEETSKIANVIEREQKQIILHKNLSLPGENRPEVERFRQIYINSKSEKQLRDAFENAISYRLYVRKVLEEKNLPPELEYLPIVESNYKTTAKSKSGAIGIWQFMENSVKPFLTLNDYVDERYDPWKATDAAIKKLYDNYNYFHDWLIAIAAYNCGTGAMAKALAKSPVKDFWYLAEHKYIPEQTALYIPKLLAIADVSINAEFYGLDIPSHEEEYNALYNEKNGLFDYITVSKAYSLNQLAQEMRIDSDLIKQLNPSFTKGYTHPSAESQIRLPLGMKQTAVTAIKKINPVDFPVKYKVVAGDSLWAISRRYGTTVKAICELNGINENDILRIGKILYIPSK